MKTRMFTVIAGTVLGCSVAIAGPMAATGATGEPARGAATANPFEAIVAAAAPAVVTIKFTMKLSSPRGETERPRELTGLMVSKDGMVLASNVVLNPWVGSPEITAVPSDLKILIGDDTEGVDARLIATDKELDLAWIKITSPATAGYTALDMSSGAEPTLGDRIVTVDRMGKLVDRVARISVGTAAGTTSKPRKLYMVDGLSTYPGPAAFTSEGKLIGVVSFVMPDEDADESVGTDIRRLGAVLLPAENIAAATRRVLEQEAERAKSGGGEAAKPAEGEKPADDKKPEGEKK